MVERKRVTCLYLKLCVLFGGRSRLKIGGTLGEALVNVASLQTPLTHTNGTDFVSTPPRTRVSNRCRRPRTDS